MASDLYGWFDQPGQTIPTHEPPRDAACPYCGSPVVDGDVRTHCFMEQHGAARSYFYRTHRTCDEAAPDKERDAITEAVLRRIAKDEATP